MIAHDYLYPLFAMMLLSALVLMRLGYLRITAIKRGDMSPRFFKRYQGRDESDAMIAASRNLQNLFEFPLHFSLLLILLMITHTYDHLLHGLAWTYVALRYVHSAIQLSHDTVRYRFAVYVASSCVLGAMWIIFGWHVIS